MKLAAQWVLCFIALTILMPACWIARADQPQAGFRGTAGEAADTDLDDLAGFPSGAAQANKIIGINAAGTAYERKTFSGTANQITLTPGVGTLVFSTPQDIHTGATPTFAGAILSSALRPSAAGGTTVGSTALPFSSVYVGGSATNNTQITGTVTAARTLTLPDADSNTVRPLTATASQWVRYVDSTGLQTRSQPAFTDISGTATIAQGGTNNGSLAVTAGTVYRGDGTKVLGLALGTALQQIRVNAGATDIEYFTPSSSSGGFTLSAKAGSYSASDGASYYYRNSATGTITLPASPNDGSVRKFCQTSGTGTFAFNGAETVRHANGTSDQALTQSSTSGVIELIARSGGWDET